MFAVLDFDECGASSPVCDLNDMPTAPILVDRISVPAGQDIQAMEKLAKVIKIKIDLL